MDGGVTNVPMVPVSLEGITVDEEGMWAGYRVLYSEYENTENRVTEEEWKVTPGCYKAGGGFKEVGKVVMVARVARAVKNLGA